MTGNDQRVAIITGGSQGIGASLVAAYRRQGWSVVANARAMKPAEDPDVLTVEGDIADPATAEARFLVRQPIYRLLARLTLDTDSLTPEQTVAAILARLA